MKYFDVLDALRNDDILNTVYRHIRREAYFLTSILGRKARRHVMRSPILVSSVLVLKSSI